MEFSDCWCGAFVLSQVGYNMMPQKDFMGTKKMIAEADNFMQETSKVVMPLDCSVVYDGKVKHPQNSKKDF